MPIQVHQFAALDDNYGYLVHDEASGATAAIDTPDAGAIEAALAATGWTLSHILNTHHHYDHAGGNEALKATHGCTIIGPAADADRIPGIDVAVADGEIVELGAARARVFDVPGHTRGHIAYWFREDGAAFVGDTLFALGCGRLFEGTPAQMWDSLQRLMQMPDETLIYCAHEYTQSNARFAVSVEPGNLALRARARQIDIDRAADRPTVPSTLGLEKATNPFLRPHSSELQAFVDCVGCDPVTVFAATRRRKDSFR